MYISPSHYGSGFGFGAPAAALAPCPTDAPIDSQAALLMSNLAPLAGTGRSGCDHKAVWTFVPSGRPESFSVLIYLHGNNNLVTADAAHPGGRNADWAPRRTPSSLRPGGPFAAGPKYEMDAAAQGSRQRPVVLVPEDVIPPGAGSRFWAAGSPGAFDGDPHRLSTMMDDCLLRLRRLRSPAGSPYLTGSAGPIRRLFLSGHSGGGQPLSRCAISDIALATPTDLWLYDCTYWGAHVPNYVRFAETWARAGRLGNNASSSRMVILVTGDPNTTGIAANIVQQLERKLGVRRLRLDRTGFHPPGSMIVEAMPNATVPQIEGALRTFPIVFIHTGVVHDQIPRVWTPRLLNTAAVP